MGNRLAADLAEIVLVVAVRPQEKALFLTVLAVADVDADADLANIARANDDASGSSALISLFGATSTPSTLTGTEEVRPRLSSTSKTLR